MKTHIKDKSNETETQNVYSKESQLEKYRHGTIRTSSAEIKLVIVDY